MLTLKLVGPNCYALFGPNGNQISGIYRGQKHAAKEWARKYASSWYNYGVDYKEIDNEETNRVSNPDIRPS